MDYAWLGIYVRIKNIFCIRCERICTKKIKLICIEQFLTICENWELSNNGGGECDRNKGEITTDK